MLTIGPVILLLLQASQPAVITIDRDNVEIRESATVRVATSPIEDANGDGVVHITADNIVVDLAGATLHGAPDKQPADEFTGIGIRITGRNVTLRSANLSGFKAGIWATRADGLTIEDCDVSGNYRQRLHSTAAAEDQRDWLWPHQNDDNQWLRAYGAGIYIDDSQRVTVRRCRARRGQNGLCLRRVNESQIYDNDFSFLSGWGIALFRSSKNTISHNSCDFCVRGYSHGVYSRGQDSAGILMFEQCCDNIVACNSATHGGDGFFGYAGNEALDSAKPPLGIGNDRNTLVGNDFSYACAIGIEMTFSARNTFVENTLRGGNYGIWGGYSSHTSVKANTIAENSIAGIAVEHGSHWSIASNKFHANNRAIQFWWDDDKDLLAKPWAQRNDTRSRAHAIVSNSFAGDRVLLELRRTTDILFALNGYGDIGRVFDVDPESTYQDRGGIVWPFLDNDVALWQKHLPPGNRKAVGARAALAGREKIIITEWGPYDWEAGDPYLRRLPDEAGAHVYQLLGNANAREVGARGAVVSHLKTRPAADTGPHASESRARIVVSAPAAATIAPYVLTVRAGDAWLEHSATIVATTWNIRVFGYQTDPRENIDAWRAEAANALSFERPTLDLPYGNRGPSELAQLPPSATAAALPKNRFGTLASTKLTFPAGRWQITTLSDDGVRVWVNEERVIENWTHHGPKEDTAVVTFSAPTEATIRVEHFELDGYAVLKLRIEPA